MTVNSFLKRYFLKGLFAAAMYCIGVVLFLIKEDYTSMWLLYVGNALFLASIAGILYMHYRKLHFEGPVVEETISGYILTLTGTVLSVILSAILYLLFEFVFRGGKGEAISSAPAGLSADNFNGMLVVLFMTAVICNTTAGFFASLFTAVDTSRRWAGDYD
ncbi:MAG: hypothetical protein JST21_04200 [Bacteroidetes bacterium]|nr:hypothetical protein [Bacteroidota bacterium]